MHPLGISCNLDRPLPCVAILMELGTETSHRATHSKIRCMPPETPHDQYQQLRRDWVDALNCLDDYQKAQKTKERKILQASKRCKREVVGNGFLQSILHFCSRCISQHLQHIKRDRCNPRVQDFASPCLCPPLMIWHFSIRGLLNA